MSISRKRRALLHPRVGKIIIIVFAIALITTAVVAFKLYSDIFSPVVTKDTTIFIPENSKKDDVFNLIENSGAVENMGAVKWVAKKKKYGNNIFPGYYELTKGMNANTMMNMLRAGNQKPVLVTFNNCRTTADLAGKVAKYICADSISLVQIFADDVLIEKYGFTKDNFPTMFIPNTYEIYWTTDAVEFATRMQQEYKKFWNEERTTKAKTCGLSPVEVEILASIVQSETAKIDEAPTVAGLYINRLKKNMKLESDPTVKYAVGDPTIRRVLYEHLEKDSPYNTYKHEGLPPGPICFPEIQFIDAVLNHEEHNYLFMCAKEDFSGYHNFAKTSAEHSRNAAKWRRSLNERKIWK
ncbi:MAG: endolytic transglycosylase MltG [Bacteroidales bacterium]